jgi:ABC-type transport system involved in cytochrome bd biosynthesis fused ATPase/permease subunit
MILILPWFAGWAVVSFLPAATIFILLPTIAEVLPGLSIILFLFVIFIWIPACLGGFKALGGANLRRQATWEKPLWELMKQEYINQMADSVNLQAQSTLQERIDALRSTYQQELVSYQQLQQDARKTEHSMNWINHLSREEQDSALWLFEMQNKRIQEESDKREKAQFRKKTAWDITVDVAASILFAILVYFLGSLYGFFQ